MKLVPTLLVTLGLTGPALAAPAPPSRPDLVVVISVDQFGADLFNANRAGFRHGLKTLSSGVVYPNAFQAHGQTETCAGHAVLLTGAYPHKTGIVANQWQDRATGRSAYCTDDGRNVAALGKRTSGVGPGLLMTSTLGEWMKAKDPRSRVFSVAGKDRSAIMMGGRNPNGAYWLSGFRFDTWGADATDAKKRLEPLSAFNLRQEARPKAPAVWTYAEPRCRKLEASYRLADGTTFESKLPPAPPPAFPSSPLAPTVSGPPYAIDALTLAAAQQLIEGQRLGSGPAPDLLTIGLSGTDMVGHAYGSQGPEMCDHLARLDAELGRFLKVLEARKVSTLVVVTADHGGGDFPERLAARGYRDARRLDPRAFLQALNAEVRTAAQVDWAAVRGAGLDISQLYLVDRQGRPLAEGPEREGVTQATLAALGRMKDVAGAWSQEQLARPNSSPLPEPPLMDLAARMRLSQYPGRSGDIVVAIDPMVTPVPALPGIFLQGHGGPYDTNRRIPLLVWWPGASAQERTPPISIADLAPTLAGVLGVSPGPDVEGRTLDLRLR